jgi:hypothetical protein
MPILHQVMVELHARRCERCGRHWACESEERGRCPLCADEQLVELELSAQTLRQELLRQGEREGRR